MDCIKCGEKVGDAFEQLIKDRLAEKDKRIKELEDELKWKEDVAENWFSKYRKLKQCLSNIEQGAEEIKYEDIEYYSSETYIRKDEVLALIKENKKEVE